jgi:predicted nuclease of predicted toxin-antitoxin system
MKIKIDENLPIRLAHVLAELGHDVDTVPEESLSGADDGRVWEAAQKAGRFLVTQDMHFADLRRFAPGTHCGILIVHLHEPGREALLRNVRQAFATEDANRWQGCFAVLTDHKLRVLSPEKP